MGLDVYLYKKLEDYEKWDKLEEEYNEKSEANWESLEKKYDDLTDQEKDEVRKINDKLAKEMGLSKWGEHPKGTKEICIEENSKKYPDHYFKIGYFRSSYNNSGINNILRNSIGKDLYSIFKDTDDYILKPNWNEARKKCVEIINEFTEYITKNPYRCFALHTFFEDPRITINSEKDAIDLVLKEIEKKKESKINFSSYSNFQGEFFLDDPLEVTALITGKHYNSNTVYVVHRDKGLDWYLKALEIVLETIDYVLSQKDVKKYVLHWSS